MIKLRKLLSCLMIVCMAFSLMPLAAFAAEGETPEESVCEHSFENGACAKCGEACQHDFDNGVCTVCGYKCEHDNVAEDGVCQACGETVEETKGGQSDNDGQGDSDAANIKGVNKASAAPQAGETGGAAVTGGVEYGKLGDALTAMQSGETVTLLDDVAENLIFIKNCTVELGEHSITGMVVIQADVTFVGGSVDQGANAVAAIIVNSGRLTLDGTTVTGDNGISVETDGNVSIEVGGTVIGTTGYGIRQNKATENSDGGTLSVTSKAGARIEAKSVGVEIINGSYTAKSDAGDIVCQDAAALDISGASSYNISGGTFDGNLSFESGVTGSITGGSFTVDPKTYLAEGYIAIDDNGNYKVVQGTKAGDVYVYAAPVTENDAAVSAPEGVTVVQALAKAAGAGSAIKKEAVLDKVTGLKTGDNVEISVSLNTEVKEAATNADGDISSATYSIAPKIELRVNGAAEAQTIPYDAALLNGSEITVTVPLVSGFVPEEIVHIHADGRDTYKRGNTASDTEFAVNGDNTVSFKVTSFSDFVMYAQASIAEVYKPDGSLKAVCRSSEEILNNLETGCTVKLLDDLSGVSLSSVDLKKSAVTLDLAGYSLTGTNGVCTLDVVGGSLTIKDSSGAGTGGITGAPAVRVGAGATVMLESGTLTGGVEVNGANAAFVMTDGTVEGATAINAVSGSVTISGGMITSTTADQEVTGSAAVEISGGSFAHAVPEAQCADGYMPTTADSSGRYGVETKPVPVAKAESALGVDQGTFTKIQDAVDAAKARGKVTLLRDSGDYAKIDYALTFDGAGCRMKNLTVNSAAGVKITNLRAGSVTVSANAEAEITSGWYGAHDGSGTYSISGGVFSDPVTQEQCALVPVFGKLTGTAASLTKYIPAQNTDPETKDAYPYTVEVAPDPRITEISDSAYFQKNSDGTLTIYTDGDYDELVKSGSTYRCLHVYNANGTDLISSRYYTVEEDANGYAVITISNSFLRNRPTGTYSVQVDFTTGVTQPEDFRVGTSPKTGDESNIGLWIGIMACSAIIIGCGVFVLIHKNKKNKK